LSGCLLLQLLLLLGLSLKDDQLKDTPPQLPAATAWTYLLFTAWHVCCLLQSLLDHMHHEEDELLPKFTACEGVTHEYLMQLGRLFEDSKLIAPSR
jgi:hypothetical protein